MYPGSLKADSFRQGFTWMLNDISYNHLFWTLAYFSVLLSFSGGLSLYESKMATNSHRMMLYPLRTPTEIELLLLHDSNTVGRPLGPALSQSCGCRGYNMLIGQLKVM